MYYSYPPNPINANTKHRHNKKPLKTQRHRQTDTHNQTKKHRRQLQRGGPRFPPPRLGLHQQQRSQQRWGVDWGLGYPLAGADAAGGMCLYVYICIY